MTKINHISTLATAIDDLAYQFDTYDYWDNVDSREESVDNVVAGLWDTEQRKGIARWLLMVVEEGTDELASKASQLYRQVTEL